MRLFIDAGSPPAAAALTLHVGDLLRFMASGARVLLGQDVLELLGPFVPGVLGTDGHVLSPSAAPNTVVFLARAPGAARIELVGGDPWRGPSPTVALDVTVLP